MQWLVRALCEPWGTARRASIIAGAILAIVAEK